MSIQKETKNELSKRLSKALLHFSHEQIAEAYGCTPGNIYKHIRKLDDENAKTNTVTLRKLNQTLDKLEGKHE